MIRLTAIPSTLVVIGALTLAATTIGARAEDRLTLAASIAPVHALVSAVSGDDQKVELLIPAGQSPHTFALKPSTLKSLANADLVFRIGADYEAALSRPLSEPAAKAKTVDLAAMKGVKLLPTRKLEEIGAGHTHDHDHDHDHDHGGPDDMHVWLDPANAIAMTRAIAAALEAKDPARASLYRANADQHIARLERLDSDLEAETQGLQSAPFIVFHDAYQYFEARYELSVAGAITVAPDRVPSAGHIKTMRDKIRASGAKCLFREPQFEPRLVETIAEGLDVRIGVLDPLGADLATGPDLYETLMRNLSASLAACLKA